jgi:hypothetical protein
MSAENEVVEVVEVKAEDVTLESVIDQMFNDGLTTYTTRAGKLVTFQQARMKQIAAVTRLFHELLAMIPKEEFSTLLALIVQSQADAMQQGRSATDLNMNASHIVQEALGENSLLLTVFASCLDILPKFVPQFCDMTADEFGDLELDEAVLVATGVVATNYGFFTQTLPRLVKIAIGGWKQKGHSTTPTKSKLQS